MLAIACASLFACAYVSAYELESWSELPSVCASEFVSVMLFWCLTEFLSWSWMAMMCAFLCACVYARASQFWMQSV